MEVRNKPQPPPTLSLPWKTRISLKILAAVTSASRSRDGTINRRLLNFLEVKAPPNPNPIKGVRSSDVAVDPSRNLWFRLFVPTDQQLVPTQNDAVPVIVFFHGGGFVYLSPDAMAYDAVCRRLARKVPAVVVSVNYRLAPEHRYPAQYDDGFDVLRFLDQHKNRELLPQNADLLRCFLAGDSAGGNLAHHVAKQACHSKFGGLKVIGLIAIQPFFGGEERTEAELRLTRVPIVSVKDTDWAWNAFLPPKERAGRDHEVINVSGPRAADISGLEFPPTIVFVGGFDPLKDWQRRYYEWLKRCGKEAYLKEYPNMIHAFYIFPELPESGQLIGELREFVQKQCSKVGNN